MGSILRRHPDILQVAAENKLIAEPYGLVGLMANLTDRWGAMEGNQAVANFRYFATQLRRRGYHHPAARALARLLGRRRERLLLKVAPSLRYSVHRIGTNFGLEHYDACVDRLVDRLVFAVDRTRPLESYGILDPYYVARKFEREDLAEILRGFLDDLYAPHLAKKHKPRWCDDTPRNVAHVDFLLELFPEAKFVHMVRDPRDVVASYNKIKWASSDTAANVHIVTSVIRTWLQLRPRIPAGSYVEIRLEDLVAAPGPTLRSLCDFLGVEFSDRLLEVDLGRSNTGRHLGDLRPEERERIERQLRDWMVEKGYLGVPQAGSDAAASALVGAGRDVAGRQLRPPR
jgi:omega-hydroxy-beta-dihydromenaquinone-9 sulfotransferase